MEEDQQTSKATEMASEAPPTAEIQTEQHENAQEINNKEMEQMGEDVSPNSLKRGRSDYQRGNKEYRKEKYDDRGWKRSPRDGRGYSPPMKRQKRDWQDRGRDYDKRGSWGNRFAHERGRNYPPNISPRGGRSKLLDGPLKTLKEFSYEYELDNNNANKEIIDKKYEEYRIDWMRAQTSMFFEEHKNDEWLKEKYSPSYLIEKYKRKAIEAASLNALFDSNFDFNDKSIWSLDYREPSLPSPPNADDIENQSSNNTQQDQQQQQEKDVEYSVVVIKHIPVNITKESILELLATVEGCSVQKVFFSEPNKQKHFTRTAYVKFEDELQNEKAKTFLFSKHIGNFEVITTLEKLSLHWKVKTTPSICSTDERISIDLQQSAKLIEIMNKEANISSLVLSDSNFISSLSEKEKLDLNIYYLRKVHLYCYYCASEYDDEYELYRKCGSIHLRRKLGETMDTDFESRWVAKLDQTCAERENYVDTTSGRTLEEKIILSKVINEDSEKSRCILCKKLFMAVEYVVKHLHLKHQEILDDDKDKALSQQFMENYFNDPNKIFTPSFRGRRKESFSPYNKGSNWRPKAVSPYQNINTIPKLETRELRSYVDLDSPGDFIPEIDYSTSL